MQVMTKELETQSKENGVLYFCAPWCGPCKTFGPELDTLDAPIIKVDVDTWPDLAEHFSIRGVPTLVRVENSQVVATLSGSFPLSEVKKRMKL